MLGLWGAANNGRRVRVGLADGQLRFGDGRFVALAPGALFAIRGAEIDDLSMRYTVVHAPLDSGKWRVLSFMDMVPDGAYTKRSKRREDIWFEPDQNQLLQLLVPFIARAPEHDATNGARFTIPLRGPLGEEWEFDRLILEGDTMTLMRGGAVVTIAKRDAIVSQPYFFMHRPNVIAHPEGNPEMALRLSIPRSSAPLSLGSTAVWGYSLPADLPRLEAPRFWVGAGELFRLQAWLEGSREEADVDESG